MRLTLRDARATVAVALAGVLYALWATGVAMTSTSTRVLGAVVFALGWVACTSATAEMKEIYGPDKDRRPPFTYVATVSVIGAVALVAGVMTLVMASETMLAVLVVAMIAMWVMATIRHATTMHVTGDHGQRTPAHA